jgi:hypothetical protein
VVILIHVSCTMLIYEVAIRFLAIKCFCYVFDFNLQSWSRPGIWIASLLPAV